MRLRQFRIRGFRCVHDSGIVPVRDVAALIGRNESGKTALLEGLLLLNRDSKLNDVDLTDGMDETSEESFRVAEGMFELSNEESAGITAIYPLAPILLEIRIVRRATSSQPEYEFDREKFPVIYVSDESRRSAYLSARNSFLNQLSSGGGNFDAPSQFHDAMLAVFTAAARRVKDYLARPIDDVLPATPDELEGQIAPYRNFINARQAGDQLKILFDEFENAAKELLTPKQSAELIENYVRDKIHPRFVFFSEYKIINGAVQLPKFLAAEAGDFIDRLESGEKLDKQDTIENLFYLEQRAYCSSALSINRLDFHA